MSPSFSFNRLVLLSILMAGCFYGCTPKYVVTPEGNFPAPLVAALPLRIGAYLSPEFSDYTYRSEDHIKGKKRPADNWTVHLGAAQTALFNDSFTPLFQSVTPVTTASPERWPAGLDAVLIPEVINFEYTTPTITRQNVFEIWIKYRFRLLAPDGSTIATWTMPVYGKTPTAFLKSKEDAVDIATMIALRDGGAAFVIGFAKVPEIRDWLHNKLALQKPDQHEPPLSARTTEKNDAPL